MEGLAGAFERIGEAVERYLPTSHAPGIALAVTDREDILGVVVRGFADVAAGSPVRPETRFQIGSISKSFAAICVMQEVVAGRLDLDAGVNELLPWLELPEPFGTITLHHLLTHTAGLAIGTEESPTGPGAIAIARTLPPTFPPGERHWYSNDGYKLVGAVLEHVTGRPVPELLRERILEPLRMTATDARISNDTRRRSAVGYIPLHDDRPPSVQHPLVPAPWIVTDTADGAIVSSVVDMSVYARALLGRGTVAVDGHEVRLLSEDAFARLVDDGVPIEDDELGGRYGLGLRVRERDGRRIVEHSGGMVGHVGLLSIDVDSGLACIGLQNGWGGPRAVVEHAVDTVRAVRRGAPPPAAPPFDPNAIDGAAELAGTYVGPRSFELVEHGSGLVLRDGDADVALERWTDGSDPFVVPAPSWDRYLLHVVRDGSGRPVEIVHGPERFAREPGRVPPSDPPPADDPALSGLYRSNDPWAPTMRVFERAGRLYLTWPSEGEDLPLTRLPDGAYAVGETWHPARLRPEVVIEGRTWVMWHNGGRWYRQAEG